MNEAVYKKLNEVCDKASSNVVINKVENDNGEYPLFGAGGLVKKVSFFHRDTEYIGIVKDGAGVGRVDVYPPYSSLVGTMQYILPKDECLIGYLKYFLIKLNLSKYVSGATIPHIYFKDYGKELIPVPSIDVQQSIVSELDLINELIAKKKSQLEDLDSLAQSLFYEMFGDPIVNEKGWKVIRLDAITKSEGGGTPSKNHPEYWNGDVIWVSSKDMKQTYISDSLLHITNEGVANSPAKLLPIGTILLVNRSGILKHSLPVAITTKELTINQDLKALIVTNENFNSIYLLYCIRAFAPYLLSKVKSVTVDSINFDEFKRLPILNIPLTLQQDFSARITAIEEEKQKIQSSLKDLETLLASRMQYYFD